VGQRKYNNTNGGHYDSNHNYFVFRKSAIKQEKSDYSNVGSY